MTPDDLFRYLGMAAAAVTFLDTVVSAARKFAKATPTPLDDAAVTKAQRVVDFLKQVFGGLSLLNTGRR